MNRLKPIRDELENTGWVDIARTAYAKQIALNVLSTEKSMDREPYVSWGLSCAEIEIDILTGNILLRRVDLSEDVGQSMNPLNDVGQVNTHRKNSKVVALKRSLKLRKDI